LHQAFFVVMGKFLCVAVCVLAAVVAVSGFPLSPKAVGDDVECVICDFLVKEIEHELAANKTQSEVLADLDKVCDAFGKFAAKCKTEVQQYGPSIIAALVNKEPPATVCKSVDLCKNATLTVGQGPKCAICELVVGEIDKALQENKTDSEIVTRLEDICKVTRHFKAECDAVVAEYVPEIIQRLVQKEDPQVVCDHIKLCDNSTAALCAKFKSGADETCSVCELLTKAAEIYVHEHKNLTEPEIVAKLGKLCGDLPSEAGKACSTTVKLLGPTIVTAIEKGTPAEQVCADLHLCSNKTVEVVAPAVGLGSNETCKLCEVVVKYGETYVKAHPTDNATLFVAVL
jgi:saposin